MEALRDAPGKAPGISEIYAVAACGTCSKNPAVEVPGNIWLDYHHYQCMGNEAGSVPEHCQAGCRCASQMRKRWVCKPLQTSMCQAMEFEGMLTENMQSLPVIIGEFSLALPPSADGYGDGTSWPKEFFQRQASLAEKHVTCLHTGSARSNADWNIQS